MAYKIAVVAGDGIGPEIANSALKVLGRVSEKFQCKFDIVDVEAGGVSIDKYGVPLTDENLEKCKSADAVLLAAVGGVKWDTLPGHLRPERALLGIRKELGLFANIRPVKLYKELKEACPLKNKIIEKGFDIVIVRELTGGMYYGERGRVQKNGEEAAFDTEFYSVSEIERIARVGFKMAQQRDKRLISVDKANVLESSRLWREVVHRVAKDFPDVSVSDMLVDNAAMQLVRNPAQFDVIVTSNMFGDILSDEASQLTGSIGMLASASLGENNKGMYEPIHGSAPDIAGKDIANPIATILSVAMLLRLSLGLKEEAKAVEDAVAKTLEGGFRTADIAGDQADASLKLSEMTKKIVSLI